MTITEKSVYFLLIKYFIEYFLNITWKMILYSDICLSVPYFKEI